MLGNDQTHLAFQSDPLDAAIEDKLRKKIVGNIFVEFSTLIRKKTGESVVVTQLDDEGELDSQALLMPTHKNKSDLTYM